MERDKLLEIFHNNTGLVYKVYHQRIMKSPECESLEEDLIQIGMLSLWKCCLHYKPQLEVKFSTYAFTAIYHSMLCYLLRESRKLRGIVSLYDPIDYFDGGEDFITYEEVIPSLEDDSRRAELLDCLDKAISLTGKRSAEIFKLLGEGYTQVEIAKKIGVSDSHVYKTIKKVRCRFEDIYFSE